MPYIFCDNLRCIRHFCRFLDISVQVRIEPSVPVLPVVLLVESNYAKTFRMFCLFYNRLYRVNELKITVRRDTDEYFPVFRDWMIILWRFIYYLVEVKCEVIVVLLSRRNYLVHHFFTLKEDSSTYAWANVYDTIDSVTLRVQSKHSHLFHWGWLTMVEILVQEDNHAELAQCPAMKFSVITLVVRILVAIVLLLSIWSAV